MPSFIKKSSYGEGFNTLNEAFEQDALVKTYRYPFDDISESPWPILTRTKTIFEALAFISSDVADITEFLIQIDNLLSFEDTQIFLPDAAAKDLLLLDTAAVSRRYTAVFVARDPLSQVVSSLTICCKL